MTNVIIRNQHGEFVVFCFFYFFNSVSVYDRDLCFILCSFLLYCTVFRIDDGYFFKITQRILASIICLTLNHTKNFFIYLKPMDVGGSLI